MIDAPVVYHLRADDPGAHVYNVTCRIATPDPQGQVLSLPAWAPGSYLVRDYARHVLSVEAVTPEGPVALRKLDKASWRAPALPGPLVLRARIYANDLSVRGAFLDHDHGFINGFCLFLRPAGLEEEACMLQVDPPQFAGDWQLVTSLRRVSGQPLEFGAFEAANYDELIDHPLLLGPVRVRPFEVAGIAHEIAVLGCPEADLTRLVTDLEKICASQVALFGGQAPMDRYVFLTTALNRGYGGLEHRDSSALICSRSDLPRPGAGATPDADYRKFLGLCSHEYFHLWNIKRIRPAEMLPYALERENYTRQLWLFEGITSYYDDLMLLRSGVIDANGYLEMLGRSLTRVYRSAGRRLQSLEEASFDAWIKFYRQDENAPNALVSYYTKGAMVALALDLELRLRSAGKVSLDDVMRALWQEYGSVGRGVPEGGFERLAEEVSGHRLDEFFHQNLRGTVDPPIGILLAQFGVGLKLRAAESFADVGGVKGQREDRPRPWLGINTRIEAQRTLVANVLSGGPALEAGLSAEDEILAVNGQRVEAGSFDKLVDRLQFGQPAAFHVFRRDELRQFSVAPSRPPRDTAYLLLEPDTDSASLERRSDWLGV